jgi:hypothetical protein
MAKISIIEREKRRERTVAKYATKRAELKRKLKDPNISEDVMRPVKNSMRCHATPVRADCGIVVERLDVLMGTTASLV